MRELSLTCDAAVFNAVWSMTRPRKSDTPINHLVSIEAVRPQGVTITFTDGYFVAVGYDAGATLKGCTQLCLYKHGRGNVFDDEKLPTDPALLHDALAIKKGFDSRLTITTVKAGAEITRHKKGKTIKTVLSGSFVLPDEKYPEWRRGFPNIVPLSISRASSPDKVLFSQDAMHRIRRFLGDNYSVGLLQAQGGKYPYFLLAVAQDGNAAMIHAPLICPIPNCVSLAASVLVERQAVKQDCLSRFGFGS